MKSIAIIFFSLLVLCLHAQEFAGEDKETCGEPVMIGIENPNPEHCYLWSTGNGLRYEDRHNPNPIVYPETDEVYRVTVTDQAFSFKVMDEVNVQVTLGFIVVEPHFVLLEEEPEPVQATLVPADGGEVLVIWSISKRTGAEGCAIGSDGIISGCTTNGKITVRATNANDLNCHTERDVFVNAGVREIEISEVSKPGRIANSVSEETEGNILKVTDIDQILVVASPNVGPDFPEGQPEWTGYPTPDGPEQVWYIEESELEIGTEYLFGAGGQSIYVHYRDEDDVLPYTGNPAPHLIEGINPFFSELSGLGPFLTSGPCTCDPTGTQMGVNMQIARKWVERNNDPGLGRYVHLTSDQAPFFELDFGGGTSCAYLERFGKQYSYPDVPGHVYIAPFLVFGNGDQQLKLTTDIKFDASSPGFSIQSPSSGILSYQSQIDGEITYAAGFAIVESLTDGPFGLESSSLTPQSSFTLNSGSVVLATNIDDCEIEYVSEWGGLQLQPDGTKLYYGSPSNPTWSKTARGSLNVMDGGSGSIYLPLFPSGIFTFE